MLIIKFIACYVVVINLFWAFSKCNRYMDTLLLMTQMYTYKHCMKLWNINKWICTWIDRTICLLKPHENYFALFTHNTIYIWKNRYLINCNCFFLSNSRLNHIYFYVYFCTNVYYAGTYSVYNWREVYIDGITTITINSLQSSLSNIFNELR